MNPDPLEHPPNWTEVICIGCARMISLTRNGPSVPRQALYRTVCMRCRVDVTLTFAAQPETPPAAEPAGT
jgi:hypothetical protein